MLEEIAGGAVAGLVATAMMTALQLGTMPDTPLLTQVLASKLGKRPPRAYRGWGLTLHFIYGIGMGIAFALLVNELLDPVGDYGTGQLIWMAMGFGLVLWVGFLVWAALLRYKRVLGEREGFDKAMTVMGPIIGHLVYGLVLGGVLAKFLDELPVGLF